MSSSHYLDSSLDAAMRQVLTEGQSYTLHNVNGVEKITAIRAALSSYYAERRPKEKSPSSQPSGSSNAAFDVKNELPVAAPVSMNSAENIEQRDVYAGRSLPLHNPEVKDEALTAALLPAGLPKEILSYLDGDIAETKALSSNMRSQFRLFGATIQDVLLPVATRAAKLILGGEAKEVEDAIALVKKHPDILRCRVTARDRSGSPGFCLMDEKTDTELSEGKKHLYMRRAEDGGLDYKVLNPAGNVVQGHITRDEINQNEIKEPLTLHTLNALAGPILDITSSRGHTPLGRKVEGKLIQIAAMAGDVNLQDSKDIKEEDRGVMERLASIEGGLSPEEVAKQLEEAITGEEAQRENDERNKHIMDAIEAFGNGILSIAKKYRKNKDIEDHDNNLREFQHLCQPYIDDLEQALRFNPNEVIKSGYIFDPAILQKSAAWFEDMLSDFGGWWSIASDVFWVNGFGKLQLILSARDKDVMRHGFGLVINEKEIPMRTLNNDNGSSFLNSSSSCGRDFFLGYYGQAESAGQGRGGCSALQNLCQSKTAALQKLCNVSSKQIRAGVQ